MVAKITQLIGNPNPQDSDMNHERGGTSKNRPQGSSLTRRLRQLSSENASLRNRIPNKTQMHLDNDKVVINEYASVSGQRNKTFVNTTSIKVEALAGLQRLIDPLLEVARAAALNYDLNRRQNQHIRDENGNMTKNIEIGSDGKPVKIPNSADRLRAISSILMENPNTRDALTIIGKFLENVQDEAIRQRERDSANGGINLHLPDTSGVEFTLDDGGPLQL